MTGENVELQRRVENTEAQPVQLSRASPVSDGTPTHHILTITPTYRIIQMLASLRQQTTVEIQTQMKLDPGAIQQISIQLGTTAASHSVVGLL